LNERSDGLGLLGTPRRRLAVHEIIRQHAQSRFRVPCCTGGFS
jgi:hypothetical protein